MTTKLKNIELASTLLNNFGGEDKVKKLGKLKSFLKFYSDPFRIIIISPWSNPLNLYIFDYEKGDPIKILDEDFNLLSLTRLEDSTEENAEHEVEPSILRDIIFDSNHADFIIVNFKDVYLALWIKKELEEDRINRILTTWRDKEEENKKNKLKSRIGVELLKPKLDDNLVIKVAEVKTNPNIKPIEEMKEVKEVQIDYFQYPTFFYPESSWWMTFSLMRNDEEFPLRPQSLSGLSSNYFKETSNYLFTLQIDQQEVLATYNNSLRRRKALIKGIITFESPS